MKGLARVVLAAALVIVVLLGLGWLWVETRSPQYAATGQTVAAQRPGTSSMSAPPTIEIGDTPPYVPPAMPELRELPADVGDPSRPPQWTAPLAKPSGAPEPPDPFSVPIDPARARR